MNYETGSYVRSFSTVLTMNRVQRIATPIKAPNAAPQDRCVARAVISAATRPELTIVIKEAIACLLDILRSFDICLKYNTFCQGGELCLHGKSISVSN